MSESDVNPDLAYLVAPLREAIVTGGPMALDQVQRIEAQIRMWGITEVAFGIVSLAAALFGAFYAVTALRVVQDTDMEKDSALVCHVLFLTALVLCLGVGLGAFARIHDGIAAATMPLVWLLRELS